MSTETRKFKYMVALEWTGTVEVDVEDDDTEDDVRDVALDMAIDECLASPSGYALFYHTLEDLAEHV